MVGDIWEWGVGEVVLVRSPSGTRNGSPIPNQLKQKGDLLAHLPGKSRGYLLRVRLDAEAVQPCHLGSGCIWFSSAQSCSSEAGKVAAGSCKLVASQVSGDGEKGSSLWQYSHINFREV